MSNGGFDWTLEIRDKFAKTLEDYKAALAAGKTEAEAMAIALAEAQAASAQFKAEAVKVTREIKTAAQAQADLTDAIGKATSKQRAQMTEEQRALDTYEKKKAKVRELARVDELAAQDGIKLTKKRADGLDEFSQASDNVFNSLRKQRVAALENFIIDEQGLDTLKKKILLEGEEARQAARIAADRIENSGRLRKLRDEELAARGLTPKGEPIPAPVVSAPTQGPEEDPIQTRLNNIIAKQKEAMELNARLRAMIQGPVEDTSQTQSNLQKALQGPEEDPIQTKVNQTIARQNELLRFNAIMAAQGRDAHGRLVQTLTAEEQVAKRVNDIAERASFNAAVNAGLAARGLDPSGRTPLTARQEAQEKVASELRRLQVKQQTQEITKATPEIAKLKKEVGETDSGLNRISFTFRRLFGILAAFTIAREIGSAMVNSVREAIRFNAELENSTLGIASLITAAGTVETATGRVANETERWTLAQQEARRQIQLLRKDSLLTAASFTDLVRGFQSAVAPGLTNGLTVDQIRTLSIRSSQAASALDVPQNQLPEEIRSLLQGTISKRNTRIATALGISNEDIARAKQMGVLFEFLDKKFEAFNKASEEGLKTFQFRLTNVKDALSNLLATSFEGFFSKLSDLFDFVYKKIISITGTGVEVNPKLVAAFQVIGDVLSVGVEEAKRIITTLSADDIRNSFTGIAATLKLALVVASDLIQGLLKGASYVSALLAPIINFAQAILGAIGPALNQFVISAVALSSALNLALLSTVGLYSWLVKSVKSLAQMSLLSDALSVNIGKAAYALGVVVGFVKANAAFLSVATLGVTALALEADHFKTKIEEATGATASWWTFFKTAGYGLVRLFVAVWDVIKDGFNSVVDYTAIGLTKLAQLAISSLRDAVEPFSGLVPGVDKLVKALDLAALKLRGVRAIAEADLANGGGFVARSAERFNQYARERDAFFKSQAEAENGSQGNSLADQIARIPGLIGNSAREMESLVEKSDKLRDDIETSQEELAAAVATLGAQGGIAQQAQLIAKANAEVAKLGKPIDASRVQAENDLLRINKERLELTKQINGLNDEQRTQVDQILASIKAIEDASRELASANSNKSLVDAAFGKGSASIKDVAAADARVKTAQAAVESAKQDANKIQASQAIVDLAFSLNDNERKELDGKRRINEALRSRRDLEVQVFRAAENRVARIGAEEFEQSKIRVRQAQQELVAATRLLDVRGSRIGGESQVASAQNEVDAEKLKLDLLREQNKRQLDALRFVADHSKSLVLQNALRQLGVKMQAEATTQEQTAVANEEAAEKGLAAILRDQAEARRSVLNAARLELSSVSQQLTSEKALLRAKQSGSAFDEQVADRQAQIDAEEIKREQLRVSLREKGDKLRLDLASASSDVERVSIEKQLELLRKSSLAALMLQATHIARMKEDLKQIKQEEVERNRLLRVGTQGERAKFDTSFNSTDRQLETLTAAKASLADQRAQLQAMLDLRKASSAEIEAQTEKVREQELEYQKLMDQVAHPVSEGFLQGIRDYIHDAPSLFEGIANSTKTLIDGISQVGANAITSIFVKGSESIRKQIGNLFLSVSNQLFKTLLDNLISKALIALIPQLATAGASAGTTLLVAAAAWKAVAAHLDVTAAALLAASGAATAGKVLAFAEGGSVGEAYGIRSYATGGHTRKKDPRDNLLGWFNKDEYIVSGKAVRKYGRSFLDDINSMSFVPTGVPEYVASGSSVQPPSALSRRSSDEGRSRPREAVGPVRAHVVASEQAFEQLLAQGDAAMQRWMAQRGYVPSWHS